MSTREANDDDEEPLTFAQQATFDAFGQLRTDEEPIVVRNAIVPHQPNGTLEVEMVSPGLYELAIHVYSCDDGRSQYSVPLAFMVWLNRAMRGEPAACSDLPTVFRRLPTDGPRYPVDVELCELLAADPRAMRNPSLFCERLDAYAARFVRKAKGFDCFLERTDLSDLYFGPSCPLFAQDLSGFRLLMAWYRRVPTAPKRCREALAQPYDWEPTRRTIGYAPARRLRRGSPLCSVLDATTALLLQQRILDQQAFGSCVPAKEHQASRQTFTRLFGVDVENAWILPALQHVEQGRTMQLNADTRLATLSPEQQDRFERQSVPLPPKLASRIIARTKADLRTTHPSAAVPPWFDTTCVLNVMNGYSFGRGGGPHRKRSRLGWAKELNRLARAAKSADRFRL